ncbi:MFS transporter [Glaciecola siphonariae]|uniref:MFS transporter n=1 Tax=Glaciecola siphonariae TaxID=521012 RepID=A0ABV9LXQ2_9ALTE
MNANKINTLTKKLAFATPEVNLALTFVTINSWLLYYFVNVVEIPAILAGFAFIIGRLADAVLDPYIGRLSDRIQHSHGRKGLILLGIIPAAVAYVALWWLPTISAQAYTQFALACLAFVVFSLFYTLITIPRHAMLPSLVPDYDQRTKQVTYNVSFVMLAVLIGIAVTPALVLFFAGQTDLATSSPLAWWLSAITYSLLGLIFSIPFFLVIDDVKGPKQAPSQHHLVRDFISVFKAKAFRLLVMLLVLSTVATMIVQSMLPFYLESVVKLPGNEQQKMLGAIFLLSILTFPLWAAVGQRIGKPRALICGILVYLLFLSLIPFIPRTGASPMLFLAAVLSGVGISAINLFPWAMLPDSVDEDTLNSGMRREGLVYSAFIFMHKCAGSIGVFSNAIVLSVFEHQAGQIIQNETTLGAFVWMTGPVPFVLFVITSFLCWRYPITKASHLLTQEKIHAMELANATPQK